MMSILDHPVNVLDPHSLVDLRGNIELMEHELDKVKRKKAGRRG
jgi:hypothetical protein